MSETASTPRALSVPDPTLAEVPPQLWLRSGRPLVGTATRVYIALVLIATALIFVPRGPVYWGLIAGGVLAYFLFPLVIQGLLAPLERRVLAATRRDANALLQEVRTRRRVRQFAPHAWLTLQEGRLHLRRGDGKAAARAFTETVRLSRGADEPALVSAQAQALLVADQPEQARELLQAQAKKRALPAIDRLHLGLAMLASKGHGRDALEHVQASATELGPHPRVLAAMALALHRADDATAALETLQRAQDALGSEPDPFDEALVQRGVKLLRTVQKAQQKRERKHEAPVQRTAGAAAPAVKPEAVVSGAAEKVKSPRRAKKEERRAARRAAKAEKRTHGVEVVSAKKGAKAEKVAPKAVVKASAAKVEVKAVEVTSVKAVEAKLDAKPVETKVAEAVEAKLEAKPVETKVAEAVEAKLDAKPVETKVAEAVEAKLDARAEVTAARPVEAKAAESTLSEVGESRPVEVVAAKVEARPVEVVESKVVEKPSEVVESRPVASEARPVSAPVLRPAPPAGASLFGSLGGSRPVSAPAGAAQPVLKTSLSPGAPSFAAPRPPVVASTPIVRPSVPVASAAPPVATTPIARPSVPVAPTAPRVASAPIVRPAAVVPVAPSVPRVASAPMSLPKPPVAPVLPPARPQVAVVMPGAPIASAPPPAAPPVPVAADLAQALPDTDDGWDDMLDALEADGPSSPA